MKDTPPLSAATLWYAKPAAEWTEALPVGNGRLGAMVFGGIWRESLQLNESTFWTGGPYDQINPDARAHLEEVRRLIFSRRYAEAEALSDRWLMAKPYLQMSFQPIGDLHLDFPVAGEAGSYRRSLDLDTAVATTSFTAQGVTYVREVLASATDGVIVMRLAADRPRALAFTLSLSSPHEGGLQKVAGDALAFVGANRAEQGIAGALSFAFQARVVAAGGKVSAAGQALELHDADEAIVLIDAGTSYRRFDDVSGDPAGDVDARLARAAKRPWRVLLADHLAEHRRLFRRLSVDLGTTPAAEKPTDARIAAYANGDDPALAALYLQFGRYLMISSSRPGTQPATLQGVWNKETKPPWGSKYTANINLEMNYWLPDPANLGECFEPLIAMAEDLAITGATMAKAHYGARGWVMHHNTDLWRATGPVDGAKWGLWPMGGAWVCAALWDHFQFAPDAGLLPRLYPLMKGATEFLLDFLVPLPGTDTLVTCPSLSPENVHPFGAALCAGPAMDNQIMRDLFGGVCEASALLGIDAEFRHAVEAALARLAPDRIGEAGQLQEWAEDWDLATPEPHHRHVSHLYGLYPSFQINPDETPGLAAAAQKALELRGDEATGWGIGWRLNLWARLRNGDHAAGVLRLLLSPDRTYPNLFDAHPPFQIDGNFGGAAGIIEMLVQSRHGEIRLLPSLPRAWPAGRIAGVRARGGFEVDLEWKGRELDRATVKSERGGSVVVRSGDCDLSLDIAPESSTDLRVENGRLIAASA